MRLMDKSRKAGCHVLMGQNESLDENQGRGAALRATSSALMRPASRMAMLLLAGALVSACSSSSNLLGTSSGPSGGPSLGDRFSQLFGGKSQAAGEASPAATAASTDAASSVECPPVALRDGASTIAVGQAGASSSANDVRYQLTITRTARECAVNAGQVLAKVGMEGRVIVGPLGAPPNVTAPIRIAVVQEGVSPKTILSKFYTTNVMVQPSDGNVAFSFVAEDVAYPVPTGADGAAYVFYIGFDAEGGKQAGRPKPRAKKGR